MGAWWAHEKSAHQKKMGLLKKKKMGAWWAPTKKTENHPPSLQKFQKKYEKSAKKGQNRPSKKNGRTKKKKWAEKWAQKKAPIFFNGRSQKKKKKGNAHFFGIEF